MTKLPEVNVKQMMQVKPVAYFDFQEHGFYWSPNTSVGDVPVIRNIAPMPLYAALTEALAPQAAHPVREQEMYKIVNFQCQCGKVHGFPEAMIPAQPVPPHECNTDAEKLAYAAGWWKALEANGTQPVREPLTAQVLHDFSPIFGGDK